MKIGELKALIQDLPNDMQVLITSDEEWNEVRSCSGFNMEDYMWQEDISEIYSKDELDEDGDEGDGLEDCLILC